MRSDLSMATVLLVAVFQLQGCTRHPTVSASRTIILGTWGTPTDLNSVITFASDGSYFMLMNDLGLRFKGDWKLDKDKLTFTTTGEEGEIGYASVNLTSINANKVQVKGELFHWRDPVLVRLTGKFLRPFEKGKK